LILGSNAWGHDDLSVRGSEHWALIHTGYLLAFRTGWPMT
jgi:hypothetical protein